ncbi:MAG: hypothetical protein IJZ42_02870 [Lachnospiraceae bacterium]|nr:hypothetical protein [Lachnospiraceae bacterium]
MNYTVFDVETANERRDSICAIGIIRYENNQIVYEKEILIHPETEFNYFNIKVHGITEADVACAPTFPEIWGEIKEYFDQTILVAHNAKSMDLCALYRTLERYDLPLVHNQYICTLELAKSIFKGNDAVSSYRLDVLANLYDIKLLNHHNALDDARACFEILRKFETLYPTAVVPRTYRYETQEKHSSCGCGMESMYSDKTKEMQKLQFLVSGIIEDCDISDAEINELQAWLGSHSELKGFYPFDKIYEVVEDIMLDGVMNAEEKELLLGILDAFINPQTQNVEIDFNGKLVCLSGEFNYGSKSQVEEWLCAKGAEIAKGVTGKLDVLILGEAGSAAWKYGNYGSKYEKACQLNEKGKKIVIVKEGDVMGG